MKEVHQESSEIAHMLLYRKFLTSAEMDEPNRLLTNGFKTRGGTSMNEESVLHTPVILTLDRLPIFTLIRSLLCRFTELKDGNTLLIFPIRL